MSMPNSLLMPLFALVSQDKYLLELRGAPDQDSLAPSESDPANAENAAQGQGNKVHYVVREYPQPEIPLALHLLTDNRLCHSADPQVDLSDLSSSFAAM
jgi:hypothetical protein